MPPDPQHTTPPNASGVDADRRVEPSGSLLAQAFKHMFAFAMDDPDDIIREIRSVYAVVALLPRPMASPEAEAQLDAIKKIAERDPRELRTADALAAHLALISVLPEADLKRKVHSLRSEFRVLAGPTVYGDYLASTPVAVDSASLEQLQAEARYLARELFGLYESLPRQEDWRNRLTLAGAFVSLVVLLLGVWSYLYLHKVQIIAGEPAAQTALVESERAAPETARSVQGRAEEGPLPPAPLASDEAPQDPASIPPHPGPSPTVPAGNHSLPGTSPQSPPKLSTFPMLIVVVLCGAFGGAVSTQQRIQRSTVFDSYPRVTAILLASRKISIWVSPVMGALFACVLYMLFAAELVSGALFPAIFVPSNPYPNHTSMTFPLFVAAMGPIHGVDIAKVMVWAFVAGFAERLVPDTLERLTTRFEQNAIATASRTQ